MQDHATGSDLAIVGAKGSGKSVLAQVFATHLGYDVEVLQLYVHVSPPPLPTPCRLHSISLWVL